jgi:hypothetical protein
MDIGVGMLGGQLPFAQKDSTTTTVEKAEKIVAILDTDASTAIGDLVRPDTVVSDKVVTVTSNIYPNIVIGYVISKPTSTTAEVLISGKVTGLSGLTFGKVVFVGTSGEVTTTVPATDRQKLGIAIGSDTIFLLPSTEKVVV